MIRLGRGRFYEFLLIQFVYYHNLEPVLVCCHSINSIFTTNVVLLDSCDSDDDLGGDSINNDGNVGNNADATPPTTFTTSTNDTTHKNNQDKLATTVLKPQKKLKHSKAIKSVIIDLTTTTRGNSHTVTVDGGDNILQTEEVLAVKKELNAAKIVT